MQFVLGCVMMCHAVFDCGDVLHALRVICVMCVMCVVHVRMLCIGMSYVGAVCAACLAAAPVFDIVCAAGRWHTCPRACTPRACLRASRACM